VILQGAGNSGQDGRTLVLIHGAGGDHRLWGDVQSRLEAAGVPAVALDLAGHGRSGEPARDTVAASADDVEETVATWRVGEWAVAGHSLGGAVALTLAARHAPGLRGAAVVSSGARLPVDPMILRGTIEAFSCTVENLARFCFARGTPENLRRDAARLMAEAGPRTLHADFTACAGYAVPPALLASVRIPVEVVCGEADVLTPVALSEEVAGAVPGARLSRLAGCGHMPPVEAPGELCEALTALWERSFAEAAP
jgi:pimeloyl-ACP methyl ester carboxylesterase